ncbi:MAG TPA: DUF4139 domain-containing protein [Bryobacteraceae bacterium]|nr:DUF4139 domain-containing protein [Bryobacteraceae bacterium]
MQILRSEIEGVTVYATGAMIRRFVELSPCEGVWPDQVRVTGLPLTLEDSSVQIRSVSGAEAPQAVSFRVGFEVVGEDANKPPGEEALQAAKRDVLTLEGRVKDLERLTHRLSLLSPTPRPTGAKGEAPPPSPHAARLSLVAFQQEKLQALGPLSDELEEKLRLARENLADMEDQKRRASEAREARPNELRKTLVISLRPPSMENGGPARLFFEYRVPSARWAPAYSLHFDADWSHAGLSVRALVAQRTGEDWRGVRLRLSTAQMHAWTELPKLTSLRVGRRQAPPKSGWRSPATGFATLYSDYDREAVPVKRQSEAMLFEHREPTSDTAEFAVPVSVPMSIAPPMAPLAAAPPAGSSFAELFVAQAPAPAPPEKTAYFSRTFKPSPPGAPQPVPTEQRSWTAPPSLDYGALHMPGADEPGRGKLVPAAQGADAEVFAPAETGLWVDSSSVVQAARTEATRLGDLPPAYAFPSSVEGFDYAYESEFPADIPSDGQFHFIPLLSCEADARLYYVTVPRVDANVFRFTEIANPLDAPLLPGPADIYAQGAFLITAPLPVTPPKGIARLGLGVEQRIKVARNTAFSEEVSGVLGGTLNLKHDIRVEVRNLLRVAAEVEVRERVPVTRETDDQVHVTEMAKPPWESYEPIEYPLRGGRFWKVVVQPSDVVQLQARYTITLPAKMEIAAGNRREE